MAKESKTVPVGSLDPVPLKRVISDINKHKDKASEHSGMAGQATSQAIESYGYNRHALSFHRKLSKMEPATSQDVFIEVVKMGEAMGILDQLDAFSDAVPLLERMLAKLKGTQPAPREKPAEMAAMLQ